MSEISLMIQSFCLAGIISTAYLKKQEAFVWTSLLLVIVNLLDATKIGFLFCVMFIVDCCFERKIRYILASQIFLGLLLQSFCELVSLLIVSTLEGLPVMVLSYNGMTNFETTMIHLGMLSVVSTLIYHYDITVKERAYSKMLGVLFVIIWYIIEGFLNALLYGNITLNDIQKFSIAFIVFGIVLIYIMFLFNKENETELMAQRAETQNAILRNNLLLMEGIQENVQDLEHRMNYVLLSLKHMILDNKKEDALRIIQANTWNLKKASYYVNTQNPYFDNLFSRILKKYIDQGIVPACFFEIPKNAMDQDVYLVTMIIDFLTQLLTCLNQTNDVHFVIEARPMVSILKVYVQNATIQQFTIALPTNASIKEIEENMIEIKLVYMKHQEL